MSISRSGGSTVTPIPVENATNPTTRQARHRAPDASVWFRTLSIPNQQRVYCSFLIMLVLCAFLLPSAIPVVEGEPLSHTTKTPDHASRVDDAQSSTSSRAFAAICGITAPLLTVILYLLALNLRRIYSLVMSGACNLLTVAYAVVVCSTALGVLTSSAAASVAAGAGIASSAAVGGNTLGALFFALTPLILALILQGNLMHLTRLLWNKLGAEGSTAAQGPPDPPARSQSHPVAAHSQSHSARGSSSAGVSPTLLGSSIVSPVDEASLLDVPVAMPLTHNDARNVEAATVVPL